MARLIPPVKSLSEIENVGERVVAQALQEQLPADVVVYHGFPWLRLERHFKTQEMYLQPGEIDFLVMDPRWGILVLEVKSSEIEFNPQRHEWRQQNRKTGHWHSIAPFQQAERNRYALEKRLEEHRVFSGPPPFTLGHAVVFTEARLEGRLPANADASIVLDAGSLRTMQRSIGRAFEHWCRVKYPKELSDAMRAAILECLSPLLKVMPVLWRTIDQQEERLHALTERQQVILDVLQRQERTAIEGVAGSGKTLLAMAQAQRWARAGRKVLLVCYNRPLADWLNRECSEMYAEQIEISTFHSLCRRWCQLARVHFPSADSDQEFWMYEAPELLMQAADQVAEEHGFDAVVVDEGQDFSDYWWLALEKIYRGADATQYMTVFLDPRQSIYVQKPTLPADLGQPYPLPTNCRNTRAIGKYCSDILGFEPLMLEEVPEGKAPRVTQAPDMKGVIKKTKTTVQEWCLQGGLKTERVAILVHSENRAKEFPQKFGNIPLVRDFAAWRGGKGILLATHRRFKGLEADALVLAGVPEPDSSKFYTKADHYVASSRAKHVLEVIKL